ILSGREADDATVFRAHEPAPEPEPSIILERHATGSGSPEPESSAVRERPLASPHSADPEASIAMESRAAPSRGSEPEPSIIVKPRPDPAAHMASMPASPSVVLEGFDGVVTGREFRVEPGVTRIGKNPSERAGRLVIRVHDDWHLSREHAELTLSE